MTKRTKNTGTKGPYIYIVEYFSSLDERFQEMEVKPKNQ